MESKKRGPKPLGLVSIHLKLLASDLEYLRQMRDETGKPINLIIRDLISGFVDMMKYVNKSKTADPGERTPGQAVSTQIVAEGTVTVKQAYPCPKCGNIVWNQMKSGDYHCAFCNHIVAKEYMDQITGTQLPSTTASTIPQEGP